MSLVWKNRETGAEDQVRNVYHTCMMSIETRAALGSCTVQPLILFPEDAKVLPCKSCRDGRVFYLKFANERREFFWMQEPNAAGDVDTLRKLHAAINQQPGQARAPSVLS